MKNVRGRAALAVTALALGTTVLSGCGSGGDQAGGQAGGYGAVNSTSNSTSAKASSGTDLATGPSDLGTIVVDGKGLTLYYFTKDARGTDTSACTAECLDAWPVATAAGDKPVVDGVTGTVRTIATPDGRRQLTLDGRPLYYFAQDNEPGDTLGQGLNGLWYVAAPDGGMKTAAPGQ